MTGIEHMVAQMSGTLTFPPSAFPTERHAAIVKPSILKFGALIEELRAEGMTTAEIARQIGLSRSTVRVYQHEYRKVQ